MIEEISGHVKEMIITRTLCIFNRPNNAIGHRLLGVLLNCHAQSPKKLVYLLLINGFLVHKDIVKSVIGCRPISSRILTVRRRASPISSTIIQVYAPISSYDDSEVDEFYRELQSLVDQKPKQDILVVQGDWNAKV